MIPRELVEQSPLQPRTVFDTKKHEELTASMRANGFSISAMTVRPMKPGAVAQPLNPAVPDGPWVLCHPVTMERYSPEPMGQFRAETMAQTSYRQRYEIVAGERRWRAAGAASIAAVPCFVAEMSDMDLLKWAMRENLDRDALSPMDEANGYRLMLERGATAEEIATGVGRSPRHVKMTLTLIRLPKEASEWLSAGRLGRNTAEYIASIPDERIREDYSRQVLHPDLVEGPLTKRAALELRARRFMRSLGSLPWDAEDATLLPIQTDDRGDRVSGGACANCPHNTLNVRDEEREEGKHRRSGECLNIACYDAKRDAVWKAFAERETDETKNRRALTRAECEELFDDRNLLELGSRFVDVTQEVPQDLLRPGVETATWKEMLQGTGIEVLVARDHSGKRRELVVGDLARMAISEGLRQTDKPAIFRGEERQDRRELEKLNPQEHKEATLRTKEVLKQDQEYRLAYHAAVRRELQAKTRAMGHAPPALWRLAAQHELACTPPYTETLKTRECKDVAELAKWLAGCPEPDALALYVELVVFGSDPVPSHDRLTAAAKAFAVDLTAIERIVREEIAKQGNHGDTEAQRS